MIRSRDNTAESLKDILALISVHRQSGVLSIEHFVSNYYEAGEIFFQSGQPTYAHIGQITGQDALTYLLSWGQVYFTFSAAAPHPPARISTSTSSSSEHVAVEVGVPPVPTVPATPRPSQVNTTGNVTVVSARFPLANTSVIANSSVEQNDTMFRPSNFNPNTPGLEWLIPQKLGEERDVLSLPLTRPQRSIYLLVNGRRNVSDISRCTRKNMQEIERLLIELQDRGLIGV